MTTNPIDLTTVTKLQNWLNPSAPGTTEAQVMQDCITAVSAAWLQMLGLSPTGDVVPTVSPLNSAVTYSESYDGSGSDRLFLRVRPIISVSSLTVDGIAIPASTGITVPGFVIDNSGRSLSIRSGFGGPGGGQQLTVGFGFLCNRTRGSGYWTFHRGVQNVQVGYTAGYAAQTITNELDTIPSASPYQITVQIQPWFSDAGVSYFTGGTLTKVTGAPATGQYNSQPGGVYIFAAGDEGKQVQISYTASGVPFDIELAVRKMVAVNYKRRQWIDQRSQSMAAGAGTISYQSWEIPPEVQSVIDHYRRRAIV
jgi:hypothetical protein